MFKKLATVAVVGLFASVAAHADSFTFDATGTNNTGDPLKFEAIITTGASGSLDVVLKNLQSGNHAAGQLFSGITFTVDSTVNQAKFTLPASDFTGNLVDVAANGSETPHAGSLDHWGASGAVHTICLAASTASCAPGGSPHDLIIGPSPTNDNASVTSSHSPEIAQTAEFKFTISGVTATTQVTGVNFFFGTGDDGSAIPGVPGTPNTPTPEPSSLVLLGTGVLGAAGMLRRRFAA